MLKRICILGGGGFVGGHLAARLSRDGYQLRIPCRRPERRRHLRVIPGVELVGADIHEQQQLNALVADCDAVINLVGILNEEQNDGTGFQRAHVELVDKVLAACREQGIPRLLHMSALHADTQGSSHYLRSKGEAEKHLRSEQGLHLTIFRPSVIFGPDDSFFNRFANLLKLLPPYGVFPLAGAKARFAPVYVGDVVETMARSLNDPATYGYGYNLCGPREYSLQELVTYTAEVNGLKRIIMPLGNGLSRLQAWIMERVPTKPLSRDNLDSMQTASICDSNDFSKFGIEPHALEPLVSSYFRPDDSRGRYDSYRYMARR